MSHNSGNARRILLDGVFNCRDLGDTHAQAAKQHSLADSSAVGFRLAQWGRTARGWPKFR